MKKSTKSENFSLSKVTQNYVWATLGARKRRENHFYAFRGILERKSQFEQKSPKFAQK